MTSDPPSRRISYIITRAGIGFPNGLAATLRVRLYTRALSELGFMPRVLVIDPSEPHACSERMNVNVTGDWQGVRFRYAAGTVRRPGTVAARIVLRMLGTASAVMEVARVALAGDLGLVLMYTETIPLAWFLRITTWLGRAPLLLDKSEIPSIHRGRGLVRRLTNPAYVRIAYRSFDSVIVVSSYLEEYLRRLVGRRTRIGVIPAMVDSNELALVDAVAGSERPYVVYSGSINEAKDGVRTLLRGFAAAAQRNSDVVLVLVGPTGESEGWHLDGELQRLGIRDRVVLTGRVPPEKAREVVRAATLAVLWRPISEQTEAGYPTKLAEYLGLGVPVVTTDVGDAGRSLRESGAACVISERDPSQLGNVLAALLADENERRVLSERGRRFARDHLDYRNHVGRLRELVGGQADTAEP